MRNLLWIEAKVYCAEEHCGASFAVELPLYALQQRAPIVPNLPQDWSLEEVPAGEMYPDQTVKVARCPDHRTYDRALHEDNDPEDDGRGTEEPSPEVIEKARRLQALAMDKGAAINERGNAWVQFEKLWKQYKLPPELGLEE